MFFFFYRDSYSVCSNFSSSIGAVCHELCHAFDLGHSMNGIMGKDFARINLVFIPDKDSNTLKKTCNYQNFNYEKYNHYNNINILHNELNHGLKINYSFNNVLSPNENLRFYEKKKLKNRISVMNYFSIIHFGVKVV